MRVTSMNFFRLRWGNSNDFRLVVNGGSNILFLLPMVSHFKWLFFCHQWGVISSDFFFHHQGGGHFQMIFFSPQWGVILSDLFFTTSGGQFKWLLFSSSNGQSLQVIFLPLMGHHFKWVFLTSKKDSLQVIFSASQGFYSLFILIQKTWFFSLFSC